MDAAEAVGIDDAHVQAPSWSPDGRRLAWEVNRHDRQELELWTGAFGADGLAPPVRIRPPARARSAITDGFATSSRTGVAHEIAWSPASVGAWAYSATTTTDDYDLFVGDAAVVRQPGADGGAVWSPDGRWLVFASARTGDGDLYALEVASIEKPPRRLTATEGFSELHATFAPDGRLAWVGHSRTGDNLWWLPTLDGVPAQLTSAPGSQLRPTFSPDGARLAFYANEPGSDRFALMVMDARPNAPWTRLVEAVVVDPHGPAWLDARTLVVVADEDAALDPVIRVGVDGSRGALDTGTVGNRDLSITQRDGVPWLAWTAQGRVDGLVRDFRRLYVAPLP